MVIRKLIIPALVLFQIPFLLFSSDPKPKLQWEELINHHIHAYGLAEDTEFKLAAYTELRGQYTSTHNQLHLDFGGLGSLTFYEQNCILKTSGKVFHLNREGYDASQVDFMNKKINEMFEVIPLLGNHGAKQEVVNFVDKHLAKKNIEPFDKLFVRHILIRHGKFDAKKGVIEFHTDDLPQYKIYENGHGEQIIKRYKTPLKIRLDQHMLRGYYIKAGGTVYVEDVDRSVSFATSEEYTHNVTAFKVFVQKLLVQSVQYISHAETARISKKPQTFEVGPSGKDAGQSHKTALLPSQNKNSGKPLPGSDQLVNGALYSPNNWMVMMLGMLRSQKINIGDRQILPYFLNQPYFPLIFELLTPEEKNLVNKNSSYVNLD